MSDLNRAVGRSERFVLTFQLEGVCSTLRVLIQLHEAPSASMLNLLQRMRTDAFRLLPGTRVFDAAPDVDEQSATADLLLLAELLRATLLAFLTPEEATEISSARVGFRQG